MFINYFSNKSQMGYKTQAIPTHITNRIMRILTKTFDRHPLSFDSEYLR
jgi:hypothetical protein